MDDKPGELIPEALREAGEGDAVKIDLNQPMADILKELAKYPVATAFIERNNYCWSRHRSCQVERTFGPR